MQNWGWADSDFSLRGGQILQYFVLRPQNVVSDCIVLSGLDARSELSEIKDFELYTFEKIDRINDEIKKGELTLVRFIPSVGAAIDCLCRRIELEIG